MSYQLARGSTRRIRDVDRHDSRHRRRRPHSPMVNNQGRDQTSVYKSKPRHQRTGTAVICAGGIDVQRLQKINTWSDRGLQGVGGRVGGAECWRRLLGREEVDRVVGEHSSVVSWPRQNGIRGGCPARRGTEVGVRAYR